MRILLVSTYELGHQPLHVASPAAALLGQGHQVRCLDLSVEQWDAAQLDDVDALAISVPMHTAMRMALQVAEHARAQHAGLPVCLYGLYAKTSHQNTVGHIVDRVIAGEYEPALLAWVNGLDDIDSAVRSDAHSDQPRDQIVHLQRGRFEIPARHLLPPLDRYARLAIGEQERLVGYVEASHGCGFHCKHCPVPTIYDGRIRIVGIDTIMADIEQLVAAGAQHITFGDPDFLNGAQHSRRVVAEMHRRHPHLTFDCTTKVELILAHRDIWADFAAAGCLFVVSAVESTNDEILAILDKGHTRADAAEAVAILRDHGIEMRPSLMPFTPWTTLADLVDLMDFVAQNDLIGNVDPVHYSIRLLLPEDSLLLDSPAMAPYLGEYLPESLSYQWTPQDIQTNELQDELAKLVERAAAAGQAIATTYSQVRSLIRAAAGIDCCDDVVLSSQQQSTAQDRPRLTEAWFCCAEPTEAQLMPLQQP